jgi:hypothetical protein
VSFDFRSLRQISSGADIVTNRRIFLEEARGLRIGEEPEERELTLVRAKTRELMMKLQLTFEIRWGIKLLFGKHNEK